MLVYKNRRNALGRMPGLLCVPGLEFSNQKKSSNWAGAMSLRSWFFQQELHSVGAGAREGIGSSLE